MKKICKNLIVTIFALTAGFTQATTVYKQDVQVEIEISTELVRDKLDKQELKVIKRACAQTGGFADLLYVLNAQDIILKENGTLEDAASYCCKAHVKSKRKPYLVCMEDAFPESF